MPFFAIENHGYCHLPLSVTGRSVYGIQGTANVAEVVEEIWRNDRLILELTGQKPRYFRSGTAYYDEVAVKTAREMGKEVINFNVLGDAGATFSKAQIERALLGAKPGTIILYHINRPESDIAEALIEALPKPPLCPPQGLSSAVIINWHAGWRANLLYDDPHEHGGQAKVDQEAADILDGGDDGTGTSGLVKVQPVENPGDEEA